MIKSFEGQYKFLSNFWIQGIAVFGAVFRNSEAAFQSQKDPSRILEFVDLQPGDAKRLGKNVDCRPDWQMIKLRVMADVLEAKFPLLSRRAGAVQPSLSLKLLDTGSSQLIEGNNWKDMFWGVDLATGRGQNWLGVLLMQRRDHLWRESH